MPKFNIVIPHLDTTTYAIEAENWQSAVNQASDLADDAGLETVGAFSVRDEHHNPIDTFDDVSM